MKEDAKHDKGSFFDKTLLTRGTKRMAYFWPIFFMDSMLLWKASNIVA